MGNREPATSAQRPLPSLLAAALVFFTSGTVLVLEILGIRLLAPYVGSSLDTYTAIIGTVLAGISLGTYLGGVLADRLTPTKMLGPVLLISGATTLLVVPAISLVGPLFSNSSPTAVILLSIIGLLVPASVLSAISPVVVKLQLASLAETGSTVGRLSAIGTAGAIAGTFLTGFVLLVHFRTSAIVITIGTVLIITGTVFAVVLRRSRLNNVGVPFAAAAALVFGIPLTDAAGQLCERESPYYCMRLVSDENNPSGRTLVLDRLRHSYVDLEQPEYLDFWYIQAMAAAFDALKPDAELKTLTIGGGGFTLPRYIAATRPNPQTTSLEIDPELIDFNRDRLALDDVEGLKVIAGDARSTVEELPQAEFDLVIADAFGNESVPWHLSTVEFARDVKATVKDNGLMVMNVIDFGDRDLLRAEIRTLQEVWPHVALIERRAGGATVNGNFVVVASNQPIGSPELSAQLGALDEPAFLVEGLALQELVRGAQILTDDYAPADQLLARSIRAGR